MKAPEPFKSLLDGERKRVPGTTISYYDGKAVVSRILRSGYFSQIRFSNSKVKHENSTVQQPATNLEGSSSLDYEGVSNLMATLKKPSEETNRIV